MSFKTSFNFTSLVLKDPAAAKRTVSSGLSSYLPIYEKKMKRGISTGARTGRSYSRGRGRRHIASARDEIIANDSGNTLRNIKSTMVAPLHGRVEVDTPYIGRLVGELDRKVFPDEAETQKEFQNHMQNVFSKIL